MPYFNTYDMLKHGAAINPDAKAISFIRSGKEYANPVQVTYREFIRKVTQTANLYYGLGIGRDDVISVILPNFLEYHFVYWGAQAAGIVNPLNYMLEASALVDLCDSAKTKILVVPGNESGDVGLEIWRKVTTIRKGLPGLKAIVVINGKGDQKNGIYSYEEIIESFQGETLDSHRIIERDDISSMFYTGGTTGAPKLAQRTHFNDTANPFIMNLEHGMPNPGETILGLTPLFHSLATVAAGSLAFSVGAHVLIVTPVGIRDTTVIPNIFKIIELYHGVATFIIPTIASMFLDAPLDGTDISSLRFVTIGGATLSESIIQKLEAKLGVRIAQGYGMTEATAITSMDPLEGDRRIGSMGLTMPYVQQKVCILDNGIFAREAQPNEIGTICLSGPTIMQRYKDPTHNSKAWAKEGWLNSGDLARQDSDGYFWFAGRSKELIRRSGHNIDPAVVEHPIYKLEGIDIAAAVAKPDPYAGETVCLYVQLKKGVHLSVEQIMRYLREVVGERAALPKEVVIIDNIPLTPVGKIFKPALKWDAIKRAYAHELSAFKDHMKSCRVDDINLSTFEKFIVWAKKKHYTKRPLSNETLNKVFVPLKTICKSARSEFGWMGFDPFLGFKKLPEGDAYEKIRPFSIKEQRLLIETLPDHWKPYFRFAFYSGLRQGEQIGLKIDDIDWENNMVHVRRAITKDENGRKVEGRTKNKYSRRSIKMTLVMNEALKAQQSIYSRFQGEYFFCSPEGDMILPQNLRKRVWNPALVAANFPIREMKQTRHTFATIALSCGENPLWIAKVMGHRDTNMIIRVYSKYIEDVFGSKDGTLLNSAFQSDSLNKE